MRHSGSSCTEGLWVCGRSRVGRHSSHCHSAPQGGGTGRAGLCRAGTALLWPEAAAVSCHCCFVVAVSQVNEAAPESLVWGW